MTASPPISTSLTDLAKRTRDAAQRLAVLYTADRNAAVGAIAQSLQSASTEIVAANQEDFQTAALESIPQALQARLKLNQTKLNGAIQGVRDVAKLPDPVGVSQIQRELDTGLILKRITCPLGVLGVIFEARPDALIQITSLAIKSGNGVILKGGKEALKSCQALVKAIHAGLATTKVDPAVVQLLTTREEITELLSLDQYVDLIIPRGSNAFVRYVQDNTRIPVLGHADGICHLYVDASADLDKAVQITVDAKTQYPAACNAIETLLVHQDIAPIFLPQVATALQKQGVELRGDKTTRQHIEANPALDLDWSTEYSDLILAIKVVDSLATAITHINTYGSKHTDAIVTEDNGTAKAFMSQVDAAGVFHNCSTRFADGFRYGFGAEVGISTQQLPPRGPVGLEGLITYKYQVTGNGHIAATYTRDNPKPFTHRDL
jgi:glutamate-5-semialdehyde dehydrogenase